MSRRAAVLALASVLTAVPGVAAASTVTADPVTRVAVFTGGAGPNDVSMSTREFLGDGAPRPFPTGPSLWFVDGAQELEAGTGCLAGFPVWCQAFHAEVNLGKGADRFGFGGAFSDGQIDVNGGDGHDRIQVNGNDNTATGGAGADWLVVGGNIIGHGYGDGGDDDIRSIASSTTILSGGTGDDLVYGERQHNQLSGDAGNDDLILTGNGGTLTGGRGRDVLLVRSARATAVTLSGGPGRDVIVGGVSADSVSADRGDDLVDVRDGNPDTVDCGPGDDTVYADADDVVADNCENWHAGAMPESARVDAALVRLAGAFGVTLDE